MGILVLYHPISRGLCGLVSAGVYGSVAANLMNFSTELAGEWRSTIDSKLLREAWGALEDSTSRADGCWKGI